MVLSRRREVTGRLTAAIAAHEITKEILAVRRGHPREPAATLTDLLFRDASHNKSYVVKRMRKGVREARLSYEEVGRTEELSLVRVQLYTGRTHQIRVQLASRKHPRWGDGKYGSRAKGAIALQSARLQFFHPVSGDKLSFVLPPPEGAPWDYFI